MIKLTTIPCTLALLAGLAHAGDPNTSAPMTPAKDAKSPAADKSASADKAPAAKMAEPPKLEMPKPPQEIADMGKGMVGTWKCTGSGTIGGTTMDFKGTITHKLDLDKWWIQSALAGSMGKLAYKFTQYTTYDAASKKWRRVSVDNIGASRMLESTGMTDGKLVWNGTATVMGQSLSSRETEDMSKDGKTLHGVGERSTDGGKTWVKMHDATCTK